MLPSSTRSVSSHRDDRLKIWLAKEQLLNAACRKYDNSLRLPVNHLVSFAISCVHIKHLDFFFVSGSFTHEPLCPHFSPCTCKITSVVLFHCFCLRSKTQEQDWQVVKKPTVSLHGLSRSEAFYRVRKEVVASRWRRTLAVTWEAVPMGCYAFSVS